MVTEAQPTIRVDPEGTKPFRITAVVPAYNEERGVAKTLDSAINQEYPFYEIYVVDDGSSDWTAAIVYSYVRAYPEKSVRLLCTPQNLGSKAKAQNYALDVIRKQPSWARPEAVMPIDADTTLADDYLEQIRRLFDDPLMAVAAGCVLTQEQGSVWEKGREIEYLVGFHWFRVIQNRMKAVLVCSGCCSVFRLSHLLEFGGFPERTMVEDIDYTWSQQIMGRKAAYATKAVAYAKEPTSRRGMDTQLMRWKSGFFQNVRRHYGNAWRKKKWLAVWITVALVEIFVAPIMLGLPILWLGEGHTVPSILLWSLGGEMVTLGIPLTIGKFKRKRNAWSVIKSYPAFYVLKFHNGWFDWKCMWIELVFVPLGWSEGLTRYVKGHVETVTDPDVASEAEAYLEAMEAERQAHKVLDDDTETVSLAELWLGSNADTVETELPKL